MKHPKTNSRSLAIVCLGLLLSGCDAPVETTELALNCEALSTVDWAALDDAAPAVNIAEEVDGTEDLPGYCRIAGTIDDSIGFEVRLPLKDWNRRFLMQGCGGLCGAIEMQRTDDALIRGYAVAHTDMGHKGPQVGGATWAYNNRQTEIDYAYRATHLTTRAAKSIVAAYYGETNPYSYFRGCSTGGRQAMVSAQKYPEDFDGIIAGAPVNSDSSLLNIYWAAVANQKPDKSVFLDAKALQVLTEGSLKACDRRDGLKDGVINDPMACPFAANRVICDRIQSDECLNAEQVVAAVRLYDGAKTSTGEKYYSRGMIPGAESGMAFTLAGTETMPPMFQSVMKSNMQYLAFETDPPLTEEPIPFNFDTDPAKMEFMNNLMGGTDPDLRGLQKAGGKLLMYHGWNDESLHPTASVDYWKSVQDEMRPSLDIDSFFRLFMIPGMQHCGAGPGADTIDVLTAIETWVEQGQAPEELVAYKTDGKRTFERQPRFPLKDSEVKFSRKIFPYPMTARFDGVGDPNDAESFVRDIDN